MNCIVKAERTWAQRIENRNTVHYGVGIIFSGFGLACVVLGMIYIASHIINPVPIAKIDDSWIRGLAHSRHDILLIGLTAFYFGTLVKWRAEDSQKTLEKTNRLVPYEPKRR